MGGTVGLKEGISGVFERAGMGIPALRWGFRRYDGDSGATMGILALMGIPALQRVRPPF
ncbi:MAG: hypothetical protein Kow0063_41500 [Anaerolineae bacterium]